MARVTFRLVTTDLDRRLRASLVGPRGAARTELQSRARRTRDRARANLRDRSARPTGEIERTIRFATRETSEGLVAQVGSDHPRALDVERGTGIYGPHRTPIRPRHAKFLRFTPRSSARTVYARTVKGQPGKHYLRDAL